MDVRIDLGDMSFMSEKNKGYTFILVLVNCFSKELFVAPLKNKSKEEVVDGLHKVMKECNTKFKHLQSDRDKLNKIIFLIAKMIFFSFTKGISQF